MQGSTRFQSVAEPAASKLSNIALCQRSAIRGLVEVRCWRRSAAMNTLDSNGWLLRMPTKVNSLWPNPRPLIALHSPYALLETGPRTCHPEKSQHVEATRSEHSLLSSAVCLGIIAKYGNFPVHFVGEKPIFSAVQTAWRRERDSNPRYPFRYSGFQEVPFSAPSLVVKHLQSESMPLSRARYLSLGSYCAPLCAPNSGPTPPGRISDLRNQANVELPHQKTFSSSE